jgi:DNA-binding NarL/FixJ family response regulator
VITDLGMPDVPGWDVVKAVKQVDATTPVVIMSEFDRVRTMRRAKEFRVDIVISKPVDIRALLATVRGLAAGREPHPRDEDSAPRRGAGDEGDPA